MDLFGPTSIVFLYLEYLANSWDQSESLEVFHQLFKDFRLVFSSDAIPTALHHICIEIVKKCSCKFLVYLSILVDQSFLVPDIVPIEFETRQILQECIE